MSFSNRVIKDLFSEDSSEIQIWRQTSRSRRSALESVHTSLRLPSQNCFLRLSIPKKEILARCKHFHILIKISEYISKRTRPS